MSEHEAVAKKTVYCRRVDAEKSVDEHQECPYCFGKHAEIDSAEHAQFCSYDPEVDPVVYGFPPDSHRLRNG